MPHRIVIPCNSCKDLRGNPIEIEEVTVWIDEDKKLYFIANCDICENSRTVQTSVEELHEKHFRRCEAPSDTPLFVM